MEYDGPISKRRVRLVATTGTWAKYEGQECDATFYGPGMNVHLNSEQLVPPLPKYQSAKPEEVEISTRQI